MDLRRASVQEEHQEVGKKRQVKDNKNHQMSKKKERKNPHWLSLLVKKEMYGFGLV